MTFAEKERPLFSKKRVATWALKDLERRTKSPAKGAPEGAPGLAARAASKADVSIAARIPPDRFPPGLKTRRVPISSPKRISGRDNPEFKRLLAARGRKTKDRILVEGRKLIGEAIRSNVHVAMIAVADAERAADWEAHAPVRLLSAPLMKSLTEVESPQGVVALVERPRSAGDWLERPDAFILILDGVQDPGNVGTLFRTAEAAGATGLLLSRGCADPLSPKALRASAGSAFRLPHRSDLRVDELLEALPARVRLVASVSSMGAPSLFDASLSLPLALALGSEGSGLDPLIEAAASARVRVPSAREVESLNVGVAGAIALFEIARQAGILRV